MTVSPRDISLAFIDNAYVNSLESANDKLMQAAFGTDYELASWFLYEWRPGFSITEADGTEYVFNSEESFYTYFRKVVGE